MQREIKFRAWDNEQKKMFRGEKEQFDDMLGFRFEYFGLDPEENVVYMQYTGVKDRRGVEIYEGDIISLQNGIAKIVVEWDEFTKYSHQQGADDEYGYVGYEKCGYFGDITKGVIIGNKYESPELLSD
jgi:uncharacterized phage protein (TIGR01671 family)